VSIQPDAPAPANTPSGAARAARLGLVLGGGAARGLAHIGVLDVLEREGIRPSCIAGTSMGGLVGALSAAGLRAREITNLARHFRFPGVFAFGRTTSWDSVFASAARALQGVSFADLATQLLVTAVDLRSGNQIVLQKGPVLPAVRATCAVPGVLPPVKIADRWLVDGGLLNVLPVDIAWLAEPDVVLAVNIPAAEMRNLRELDWSAAPALSLLGRFLPNPLTARLAFEVLVRASEIVLGQQTALATAMTGPELLVEPRLEDMGLRDFDRLDDAVAAGRRAAEAMLPALIRSLAKPPAEPERDRSVH